MHYELCLQFVQRRAEESGKMNLRIKSPAMHFKHISLVGKHSGWLPCI